MYAKNKTRLFTREIFVSTCTCFNREDPVIQRSVLSQEISRLKKVAGPTVGQLSIAYGVDVEDELASIIPFRAA